MITVKYQVYITGLGWTEPVSNWQIAGTVGEHKAIEAIRITEIINEDGTNIGVAGQAHMQDVGWLGDATNSEPIGVPESGKHLEAVKIGLFGNDADKYDIWYRLHVENVGFLPPVRNSEPSGTEGQSLQAEAIQLFIHKKTDQYWFASDTSIPFQKIQNEVAPVTPTNESEAQIRKRIIDEAASHLNESGTNFQARMGIPGLDWCNAFVSCIFIDCGVRNLIPITTYVPTTQQWAINNGKWRGVNSGYMPQSGDLVIYDFNGNGTGDHIGIVHSATSARNINAVEGNTGSKPTKVMMRGRTSGILGYVEIL